MTMVSPDSGAVSPSESRTARYKKITKPLLERKRRARINRCLDELKDIMVGAFEMEGDNISKLEKADILELTVRHLTKLHSPQDPATEAQRFQAGFGQCATEACQFILAMPGVDSQISQNLVRHLTEQITELPLNFQAPSRNNFSPTTSCEALNTWPSRPSSEYPKNSPERSRLSPNNEYEAMQSYRREEVSRVPVEQSLVCDTTHVSGSSKLQHYPESTTGLLMTVDDDLQSAFTFRNSKNNEYQKSDRKPVMPSNYENNFSVDAKNILKKKIREQILERQVRESDSRRLNISSAHDLTVQRTQPVYCDQSQFIKRPEQIQYQEQIQRAPCSSTTYDNSRRYEVVGNYSKKETACDKDALNFSQSIENPETSKIYEKIINECRLMKDPEEEVIVNNVCIEEGNKSPTLKRRTDYRSIHPKKVMIRNPSDQINLQTNMSDTESAKRNYSSPAIEPELSTRSSLREQRVRDQRPSSTSDLPIRYQLPDSSHHSRVRDYNYKGAAIEGFPRQAVDLHRLPRNFQADPRQIDLYGHREAGNPHHLVDQDDSMWRPW